MLLLSSPVSTFSGGPSPHRHIGTGHVGARPSVDVPHADELRQHPDDKMLDQRVFSGEEAFWHIDVSDGGGSSPPVPSLSYYRRVIRGRNICLSACMVCCPISGWSQAQRVAKHTQVGSSLSHTHTHTHTHTVSLHVWAAALPGFPRVASSNLNAARGGREISSAPRRLLSGNTQPASLRVSWIF